MSLSLFYRILAFLLLLGSILFLPFQISIILALAGMGYFSFFIEAPLLFLLSDVLYGIPEGKFSRMIFVSFVGILVFLAIVELVKSKLRLEQK